MNLHNITLSIHQMKRIMKRLHLRRRNISSPFLDIVNGLLTVYQRGFSNCGYRTIWKFLRTQTNVVATQEQIRFLLKELDPEGVELRSRHRLRRRTYVNHGPNYLVHTDGYDKLKPYGIAIHGCIDGYSRRILWLEASSSNNDPKIVGRYYIDFLKKLGRVPRCVRSDAGTENVIIRDLQIALRLAHDDTNAGCRSFLEGRSTGNQRIEQFWGTLKHSFTVFWRNLFRDLSDRGKLCIQDPIHIECLRFSFMRVIQRDLDMFASTWNLHRIRRQRNSEVPNGIPNVLYFQPELTGTRDFSLSIPCSPQCLNHVGNVYTIPKPRYGCNERFLHMLEEKSGLDLEQLPVPLTAENSVTLFCTLTEILD